MQGITGTVAVGDTTAIDITANLRPGIIQMVVYTAGSGDLKVQATPNVGGGPAQDVPNGSVSLSSAGIAIVEFNLSEVVWRNVTFTLLPANVATVPLFYAVGRMAAIQERYLEAAAGYV